MCQCLTWKAEGNMGVGRYTVTLKNVKCFLGEDRIDILYLNIGVLLNSHVSIIQNKMLYHERWWIPWN